MASNLAGRAGTALLDLVYPRRCAGCGKRGVWLCVPCEAAGQLFSGSLCTVCGVPERDAGCLCGVLPQGIDQVRSVGPYEGWLRSAVIQMKYGGEWARARHLAPWLANACEELLPADALVPVPLHPARRKQRGFNQTEKLAEALGAELAVPVEVNLRRTRKTAPQVRLDAEGRQRNVDGAFELVAGASVVGKRLILVDDVITTGATLGACAQVLRAGGATGVSVITVAREL